MANPDALARALAGDKDLAVANLSGAFLDGALYDDTTKWPAGFDPVAVGAIKK